MDRDKKGKEEKRKTKKRITKALSSRIRSLILYKNKSVNSLTATGKSVLLFAAFFFFFFFFIVVIHPVTPQVSSWLTALIQTIQSFRVNFLQLLTPSPSPFLSLTQTFFFRPSYTEKADQILRSNAQIFIRNNISRAIILRHSC